jgi:hypothetical protein
MFNTIKTNLQSTAPTDSSAEVREFFNKYFTHKVSFPAAQIDAVNGFFLKRGFDDVAAKSLSTVLLNQARIDNVDVFELLDTLKGTTDIELSSVVTEIFNLYREKTSVLGYKEIIETVTFDSRNILA